MTANAATQHPSRPAHGVSLLEFLLALCLLGLLSALAAPSFYAALQRHRVDVAREELLGALQLARAEALRQGVGVVVERLNSCSSVVISANNWSCGWQIYPDLNANNSRDEPTEAVLQTVHLPSKVLVHKSANPPLGRVTADRFGQLQPLALHFVISPDNADPTHGGILCMGAGARFRWIRGATSCA
jgi:type IV fimbrial biogenesis protein FimT